MIEKTPRTALIRELGDRLARHPRIEAMVQEHIGNFGASLRALIPVLFEDVASQMSGGETLRIYPRKTPREQNGERNRRIEAALVAGEAYSVIAKRERITERHVRRLRIRMLAARSGPDTP